MKPAERSNARLAVVQALYQMELAGKGLHEVQAEFEAHWIGREIEGARLCAAQGVDCINVPDGPRASARMSAQVACQLIQQHAGIEAVRIA